ncbi:hypothetical protein PRO82_000290 [Candidatus Protochlamydia amoebophila]|nr:hypothetical protein [Candidatus Protochlamydia amoebophila]
MNKKHLRNLEALFKTLVHSNVICQDVEKLFIYLGARIKEGDGSRLAV